MKKFNHAKENRLRGQSENKGTQRGKNEKLRMRN
jgi:hypothetical protein